MLKSAGERRPAALCIAQDQAEGGGATLSNLCVVQHRHGQRHSVELLTHAQQPTLIPWWNCADMEGRCLRALVNGDQPLSA